MRVVLITGCSSGIGRATAELLLQRGHLVAATARRPESLDSLRDDFSAFGTRAIVESLDVVDPKSIAAVVDRLTRDHGRIDAVVNNAAYGQAGAVEELSPDDVRRQMEVNVIGVLNVTRAAMDALRRSDSPRIINVSSVVAHVPVPLMGAYCASKAALNAMTVCMRMETAGERLRLILIEPAAVKTEFRTTAVRSVPNDQGKYARAYAGWRQRWNVRLGEAAAAPEVVARVIARAVEAKRPKTRYRVTWAAKLAPFVYPLLPDGPADRMISRMFGVKPRRST